VKTKTRDLIRWLFHRKIIGGKHTPEEKVIHFLRHCSPEEQTQVKKEWEMCIKQFCWILRMKKTGKQHVSLNPRKLSEIMREIE
jgi:hypothetical protein